MADNYALKGALKGLMAGLRGVVSGKLAVEKASNERARKEAEVALENRKQNWLESKQQYEEQLAQAKEGREAIKFKNEQAAAKAEEERKKLDHERLENLNDDWDEALGDLTTLEKELETETDPEKRKIITEKISAKRARILGIASRIGKRQPGIEAEQESEAAAAEATTKHTRALELETKKAENEKALKQLEIDNPDSLASYREYEELVRGMDNKTEEEKEQMLADYLEAQNKKASTTRQTNSQAAQAALDSINDEDVKSITLRIGNRLALTDKEAERFYQAVAAEFISGNRAGAMRLFGDKFNDLDTSKLAGLRLRSAKELVAIRDGLRELKNKYGVTTGRLFSEAVENMSKKDFNSFLKSWSLNVTGIEKLTDEQKRKAVEIQTRITRHLVEFLKEISGAAVNESEFVRVQGMLPAIFKDHNINEGSIDGNLLSLRTSQQSYYSNQSDDKIASEVLDAQGWSDIKTSEEDPDKGEPEATGEPEVETFENKAGTAVSLEGIKTIVTDMKAQEPPYTREETKVFIEGQFESLSAEQLEALLNEIYGEMTEEEPEAEGEPEANAE